jgi:hypothetical protein
MTNIAVTNEGLVSGTSQDLVDAVVAALASIPSQPLRHRPTFADLAAAVRLPWADVPVVAA